MHVYSTPELSCSKFICGLCTCIGLLHIILCTILQDLLENRSNHPYRSVLLINLTTNSEDLHAAAIVGTAVWKRTSSTWSGHFQWKKYNSLLPRDVAWFTSQSLLCETFWISGPLLFTYTVLRWEWWPHGFDINKAFLNITGVTAEVSWNGQKLL